MINCPDPHYELTNKNQCLNQAYDECSFCQGKCKKGRVNRAIKFQKRVSFIKVIAPAQTDTKLSVDPDLGPTQSSSSTTRTFSRTESTTTSSTRTLPTFSSSSSSSSTRTLPTLSSSTSTSSTRTFPTLS